MTDLLKRIIAGDYEPAVSNTTVKIFGVEIKTTEDLANGYYMWYDDINQRIYAAMDESIENGDGSSPIGAIGGNFTLEITQTSLGIMYVVSDSYTKTKYNLTNYDEW